MKIKAVLKIKCNDKSKFYIRNFDLTLILVEITIMSSKNKTLITL